MFYSLKSKITPDKNSIFIFEKDLDFRSLLWYCCVLTGGRNNMDIINELWYGNVSPFEQCTRGDKRLKEFLKPVPGTVRNWTAHLQRSERKRLKSSRTAWTRCTASPSAMLSPTASDSECSWWLKPSFCHWVRTNSSNLITHQASVKYPMPFLFSPKNIIIHYKSTIIRDAPLTNYKKVV